VSDITQRKKSAQKIQEQAALINIATDAIFSCNLQSQILFWNQGAERLYGWQVDEVIGQDMVGILRPRETDFINFAFQSVMEKGSWQGEILEHTKTDEAIIVESRWTLMCDDVGKPKSILIVNTNITQKKHLESQFLRVQRLESVGTLSSGIAHDLNNIFTPILASAQLLPLKYPDADDRTKQLLKMLEDSAHRGADLVKQILSFGRGLEGQKICLQPGHLLREVVQVMQQTFPKMIIIHSDISTRKLGTVLVNDTQLHQVLMNLCINARDAMSTGGTLSLAAETCMIDSTYVQMNLEAHLGSHIVITISDTGMGIAPNVIDRIFDPFFTTKEVGKGTGLGLSTVLGIVKSCKGWITVHSEVKKGTTFKIYLPTSADLPLQPPGTIDLRLGQGELVLIVEDEMLVQQSTKNALEDYNYKTLSANDGIEAIALYAKNSDEIDVVLMDVMMPVMDGFTAVLTLKKLNPEVKIIATSGLDSNRQIAETSETKVAAFLPKPYTVQELLMVLQQVLHKV
jgi:hypothetical protein